MNNFETAYQITREKWEGGYANIPGDKGGETYAGISRILHPENSVWSYIDFMKRTKYQSGIPHNTFFPDIEYLVKNFYENIWLEYRLQEIKDVKVASLIFDYIVHSGKRGAKNVQAIIEVAQDGIFGTKTISVINVFFPNDLYEKILKQRKNFLNRLADNDPTQEIFREGWMKRIEFFSSMRPYSIAGISSGIVGIVIAILMLLFLLFKK